MRITIDNLDGLGVLDYTRSLSGAAAVTIERALNRPSRCVLSVAPGDFPVPANGGRVVVNAENGVTLFTGYIVATPERVYAGMGTTAPVYVAKVVCMSDEVLLDARVSERTIECVASSAGDLLATITGRATPGSFPISGSATTVQVGGYQALAGKSWSANVGALANAVHASYRVMNNALLFENIGGVVHTLAESDGSLDRSALRGERLRQLVNDVTVCGKVEPQTYVTEIFEGDGVTSVFELSEAPLLEKASLMFDTFSGAEIDPQVWVAVDGGGHLSLTNRGLTLGGGSGASAASRVTAVDSVEMGGVLLLEVGGLEIGQASEGYFAGLSAGSGNASDLITAFHIRANGTGLMAAPVILGAEAGPAIALEVGHTYTLRLRFHCRDRQRSLQTYIAGGASGVVQLGGDTLVSSGDVVMEVQETTGGAFFPAVVLYDGGVAQVPPSCTPVAVNSVNFIGSIASFELTRPGEVWMQCSASGSAAETQRLGATAQSAQAKVTGTGRLSFYPNSVPAVGTTIRVSYRLGGHAIARMTASTTGAASSLILTAEHPTTRTSADCENAALAVLALSTWPDGAWKGNYTCWNPQRTADVWPGDLLQVDAPSSETTSALLIRDVTIAGTSCSPELLHYKIGFANEWAEPLSLKLNEGAPLNAWLPSAGISSSTALPSLRDLSVSSVSTTQIQIAAGATAPSGGGFEVRRSDWKFGSGSGADLVLRSPAPNFTIVREAPVERYYVRIYDGMTPPNYSRFSSAIFVNAATQ